LDGLPYDKGRSPAGRETHLFALEDIEERVREIREEIPWAKRRYPKKLKPKPTPKSIPAKGFVWTFTMLSQRFPELNHNTKLDGLPRVRGRNMSGNQIWMYTLDDAKTRVREIRSNISWKNRKYPRTPKSMNPKMSNNSAGLKRQRTSLNEYDSNESVGIDEKNIVKSKRKRTSTSVFSPSFTGQVYQVSSVAEKLQTSRDRFDTPLRPKKAKAPVRNHAVTSIMTNRANNLEKGKLRADSEVDKQQLVNILNSHLARTNMTVATLSRTLNLDQAVLYRILKFKPVRREAIQHVMNKVSEIFPKKTDWRKKAYSEMLMKYSRSWANNDNTNRIISEASLTHTRSGNEFARYVSSVCKIMERQQMDSLDKYEKAFFEIRGKFQRLCTTLEMRLTSAVKRPDDGRADCPVLLELLKNSTVSFVMNMWDMYRWNSTLPLDLFSLILTTWRRFLYLLEPTQTSILTGALEALWICLWRVDSDERTSRAEAEAVQHFQECKKNVVAWIRLFGVKD